jgi:Uma2 family endonuclease
MAQKTKKWTLAEVHRLPDDGNKYELVRGDLFVTPPPSVSHEELAWHLRRILTPYVESQGLGRIYSPSSVIQVLESQVEPDLMVRAPLDRGRSWADQPLPILVVEVASDSTRRRDRLQKRELYVDAGVLEYWIVDGETRQMTAIRLGQADVITDTSLTWSPAGAREPLVIDVRAYFRAALG